MYEWKKGDIALVTSTDGTIHKVEIIGGASDNQRTSSPQFEIKYLEDEHAGAIRFITPDRLSPFEEG